MLRDVIIGERPHDSSAGPASLQVLGETNAFIHKHFWLTVNFPAIAPGTPSRSKRSFSRQQLAAYNSLKDVSHNATVGFRTVAAWNPISPTTTL